MDIDQNNNSHLPVYDRKSSKEDRDEQLIQLSSQLRLIKDQQKIDVPMQHTKIRCGCLKLVSWQYMYRCLYCGIWYCGTCAEQHFGYRRT